MEKNGPNAIFNLIFLGLGWSWVGEFVGFMIMFTWYMFSNPTGFGISQTPKYAAFGEPEEAQSPPMSIFYAYRRLVLALLVFGDTIPSTS